VQAEQSATGLEHPRNRLLAWEGCLNARDLGGYATEDGRVTRWGAVVRSDALFKLSPGGQRELIGYGIRTIVDLRRPVELVEEPNPFAEPGDHGIDYINKSFIIVEKDPNIPFTTLVDTYMRELGDNAVAVGDILKAIADAREGGVLIHCAGGRDRTGLISALLLSIAGVPPETIAEDYALSTDCLRPRDNHYLESGPGTLEERELFLEKMRTHPEVLLETFRRVEDRYGSVRSYLLHGGVTNRELSLLQTRLIKH
jgi:protein-tyrosine phosphatase